MTTLHGAAQKAIDWLDQNGGAHIADELRSALAQQGEPVAKVAEIHMSRYTLEWVNGPLPEGTELYAVAAPAAQPDTNHLQDIAACIGVGGYNGATDEQLVKRICDEFLRLTPPAPHPDTRTVVQQMLHALKNANNSGPYPLFTEAIAAGQQWMKENGK